MLDNRYKTRSIKKIYNKIKMMKNGQHIANTMKYLIDIIFIINLNPMDIVLLLVVNCKSDIIIDRTLCIYIHDTATV